MDNIKNKTNGSGCNTGVSCDVSNCHYHCGECGCHASRIKVGHNYASNHDDTVCDTFRPRTGN